jgi:hypothetical protein
VYANNDDVDPKFEEAELEEKKILPATYEAAFQFASEVYSNINSHGIREREFPDLTADSKDEKNLSEKASWYLKIMLTDNEDTNRSIIERLIVEKYQKLY